MNESFRKVITKIMLSLLIIMSFNFSNTSYAFDEESKIDLLISNQELQKQLKEQIEELNNNIELKSEQLKVHTNESIENEENNNIEVVTVSFVPEEIESNLFDIINSEIISLEQGKNILQKELQDSIIKGVQIEKSIEEDISNELAWTNSEFKVGIWPLENYKEISSAYGYRIHPITKKDNFHKGIDIPAPQDTDILAIDDGVVTFSGYQNGYGNVVKIKHFDGKKTVYAHNNSNVVSEGEIVKQGQVISKVGTTGTSTGNHVHFEIIVNDENINPINGVIK